MKLHKDREEGALGLEWEGSDGDGNNIPNNNNNSTSNNTVLTLDQTLFQVLVVF